MVSVTQEFALRGEQARDLPSVSAVIAGRLINDRWGEAEHASRQHGGPAMRGGFRKLRYQRRSPLQRVESTRAVSKDRRAMRYSASPPGRRMSASGLPGARNASYEARAAVSSPTRCAVPSEVVHRSEHPAARDCEPGALKLSDRPSELIQAQVCGPRT